MEGLINTKAIDRLCHKGFADTSVSCDVCLYVVQRAKVSTVVAPAKKGVGLLFALFACSSLCPPC